MISFCPMAASACFSRVQVGRWKLIFAVPACTAPEETRMISRPSFLRSDRTRASVSRRYRFSLPVSCVMVEEPIFTTMRLYFCVSFIAFSPIF